MRAEVICLLAAQVATAADLLHPNLLNVAYSASLNRCSGSWLKVTDYFKKNPPDTDKAKDDDRGFYRTVTDYYDLSKIKEQCFCAIDD